MGQESQWQKYSYFAELNGLSEVLAAAFGFGGVARIGQGELSAEWVLSEHVRLGSSWVILSRAFHGGADCVEALVEKLDLSDELHRLRLTENALRAGDAHLLESNRQRLEKQVFAIARGKWTQA